MSVSTALAARLECLSEQVEKLLAHVETDVLSGNQEATLSPTPADGPKSTVGIMLSDLTIHNMVVGGPAFNSRLINIGDRIVAVDGQKVGLDNFEAALVGSDLPGSEVVLTVFRESEKIEKQVTLRRMARSAMSDLVTMFEQFTRLEGLAADFDDPELSQCLEEAVRQWTKLQIASSSQERSTARRVNQMQSDCRALTLDLRKQIQELHHEWLEDLRPRAAEPETPGLGPAFRPSSWTPGAPTVVVTSLSATDNTDSAMPPSLSIAPPPAKDESVEVQKASVQELTAECLSICDDLRRSMAADVMAPIPIKRQHRNIEEVQCGSADGELTTTGIVFNGLVVQNMIVGSPAYTCAELDKGDEIRSVDGVSVTPSTLAQAMIGPDLIGSEVTLTVMKKKTQAKREITLVRMARETLADYVHMFSLFTAVKEYALLSADEEGAACVDKCISHWTNMLLSSASEEQMTRIHVKRLQQSGVQCICKLQQRLDDVMKAFLTDLQGQERERKVEIQQFEERLAEREGEARALLSKNEVIVAEASKQQEARRQHLLSMIVKRMLKAVLSAGFARWRQNLRDQKILMTKTSRALRRWRNRAFASVFGRWAWYADERSRVRVQMSRILLRLSNRAASLAFEMWMNGVRIASQERAPPPPLPPPPRLLQELELEKEAKEVLKTKLLANEAAFRETEEKLVASQDRRLAQARRVVQRLLHSQLAGAFDSFHSRVVETQSKRQLCQRAVSRMQHLCLEDAWQMFTATVQQLKTHRGMVARAVSRWKLPGARIAFDAWLQYMLHVELNEAQSAVEKSEQKIRDETAILKQECEQSTTMIAKAAAELTSTQEKVAELETALSEKEALLKSRTTELSHTRELLDDCTMLMKKNEESEAMLKLEGHKVEQRLWAALSALEKELMEKNETLLSLKAKEEQVQRQLIEERARTLETETLLQARDDRAGRLEATLAEMEVQKTECAKYTRQLEQQAEIAAASIINLSHDIDRTKEEVALKIFHLRGDLEGRVTRERNQLCAMLEVAWAEVNTLKRERDGLQQELAAGTQWADDLDSQVEVLRFELTCKTDTLKTHEEEAQRMAACLAEKEEAVHDSVDRLKAFKAEAATGLQQAEERRKIQLMSLSVRRLLRVAARKAFLHWCQHIQELATTAAKSQTVLARWKNRSGAKCFDAWHDHSMGETQKRKVMAKVVKRLQVRGILNAFTAWDMVVVEAIANRESEKQRHASMTTSEKLRALELRAEQLQSSLVERDASIEGLRNRVQELKAELSEVISGAVNLKMASEAHIIHLEQQSQLAASSVSSLKDDMEQIKRELSQKLGRIKSELETRVVNERSQLLLLLEQAWSQLQDQKSDADLLEAKVTEKELRVVGLEGRVEALTGVLSDVRESAERARVESQDSVALLERELAQEKGQVKASALELKTLADCLRRLQEQKAGWKDMLWRCRQLSSTLHARLAKSPLEAPNTLSHDLLTSLPGNSSLPSSTSTTTVGVMFDAQGVVESILPGGPAHTSRKIEKGDQIIQVDGVEVSGEDLLHAITGSDLPSSVVTLTVRKKATSHIQGEFVQAGEIVNVSLQRLSTARVAMRRRVFDNFTMLHGKAKQDSDTEARVCIQETLELWEKMLVTQHDQDAQFELNVRALQEECCGWTQELSSLLAGIDAMQGWHEGDSASAHVLPTFGNELRFARETEVEEQEEGEDTPRARSINSSADSPFQAGRHFTLFSSRTPHQ